ncbi:MAG: hypothetical protein Q9169_003079 [Polycauliona sp. 2 TL-2023]
MFFNPLQRLLLAVTSVFKSEVPQSRMMHLAYFTALLSATIATAAPSLEPRAKSSTQVAKFDDLRGIPGLAISAVGDDGVYQNLNYPGFVLIEFMARNPESILQLPGLRPTSPNNVIAWGDTVVSTLQNAPARIEADFPDSRIKSVNLLRFNFGCTSATKSTTTDKPLSCDIALTCNRADGSKVGPQTFQFRVGLLTLAAALQRATPAGFTDCTSVVFDNPELRVDQAVIDALPLGAVIAARMDDVTYTTNS